MPAVVKDDTRCWRAAWGAREVISIDLSDAGGHCLCGDPASRQCARGAGRHLSLCRLRECLIMRLVCGSADCASQSGRWVQLAGDQRSSLMVIFPFGSMALRTTRWITKLTGSAARAFYFSRINPRLLMHLSKVPTAILFMLTKLVYGPLKKIGAQKSCPLPFLRRLSDLHQRFRLARTSHNRV